MNGSASFVRVRALKRDGNIANRAEGSWVGWWRDNDGNVKREMVCHGWDLRFAGLTLTYPRLIADRINSGANTVKRQIAPAAAGSPASVFISYDFFPVEL